MNEDELPPGSDGRWAEIAGPVADFIREQPRSWPDLDRWAKGRMSGAMLREALAWLSNNDKASFDRERGVWRVSGQEDFVKHLKEAGLGAPCEIEPVRRDTPGEIPQAKTLPKTGGGGGSAVGDLSTFIAEAKRLRTIASDAENAFLEHLWRGEQNRDLWAPSGMTFLRFIEHHDLCKPTRYERYRCTVKGVGLDATREVGAHAIVAAGKLRDPALQREALRAVMPVGRQRRRIDRRPRVGNLLDAGADLASRQQWRIDR